MSRYTTHQKCYFNPLSYKSWVLFMGYDAACTRHDPRSHQLCEKYASLHVWGTILLLLPPSGRRDAGGALLDRHLLTAAYQKLVVDSAISYTSSRLHLGHVVRTTVNALSLVFSCLFSVRGTVCGVLSSTEIERSVERNS